jgi:teichuronic acid biosynthesis glycosyltransferase TuaC
MLRVLTLSSLFPDESRPTFGPFVERQTLGLAGHPDVDLRVVAPIGLPPWPLSKHPRFRAFSSVPEDEVWRGTQVYRPRFVNLPGTGGRFAARAMTRALVPLLDQIRSEFPFDVIDAEFFFPDGPAALALGERYDVPVSIKARGADIHFWGNGSATARQVLAAGQRANGLLAVAQSLKTDMVALGMPGDKIRVHYTGVDLSLFQSGKRQEAKRALGIDGPLVLSVGALIPRKRQALTMEAVAKLDGVTLALIGNGADQNMLVGLTEKLGISGRVKFLGALPHTEIANWLAAADAMCLPSSSEGLANAWVEALACGTPIVICDVGGARELLDQPDSGHIVAPEASEIASALLDLIQHPRNADTVRKCAERFTWDTNRDTLYAHLVSLIDPGNPQPE